MLCCLKQQPYIPMHLPDQQGIVHACSSCLRKLSIYVELHTYLCNPGDALI
jgi:hypothetical protein